MQHLGHDQTTKLMRADLEKDKDWIQNPQMKHVSMYFF